MANFSEIESSDDSFVLSASSPSHISATPIPLSQTESVAAFTGASDAGVQFWVVDSSNAQQLVHGQSFQGYQVDPSGYSGLSYVTLPAGDWYIAARAPTLSGTQTAAAFTELSLTLLAGGQLINNVALVDNGNAGTWKSVPFTIVGSPQIYVETEGSGGKFMIMSNSQLQLFESSPNSYIGGSYPYTDAFGGQNGGPATELEGQLQLSSGSWNLVWINDTNGWASGTANITAFATPSTSGYVQSPTSPPPSATPPRTLSVGPDDLVVSGSHTQYEIAYDASTNSAVVRDMVPGRDGTQTIQNLHDIIFTDGIGRFDPTGSAEEAARIYQAALDRAPDPAGLDYWAGQLDSHALGIDGVALGFINSAEFQAKYGTLDNAQYVSQLYQNVLHRAPDSAGDQYWVGQLNNGTSRADVLVGFSDSLENKIDTQGSIGDPHMDEAYRLYQAAFDRSPDMPGLAYWTGQLDNGLSPLQMAQGFVNSSEFAQLFTGVDTQAFVERMYENVLHRAPDAAGEQYWIGQLNQGTTRAQVLLGFSDSLENRLNTSQATHDGWVYLPSS